MNSIIVMGMKGRQVTLLHKQIAYVQADGPYCIVHLVDKQRIVISRPMLWVLPSLGNDFIRTHRAYVVNREFVASINSFESKVTLKNGVLIPISRRQLNHVCETLGR